MALISTENFQSILYNELNNKKECECNMNFIERKFFKIVEKCCKNR